MKQTLFVLAIALLIGGCGSKQKSDNEIIRPSQETVINYSDGSEDRETIN